MIDLQDFAGKRLFIAPDVIVKLLTIEKEEFFNRMIKANLNLNIELITSDFALYEALSSITKQELKLIRLNDFLMSVHIVPSDKIKIDMDRMNHLRNVAGLSDLYTGKRTKNAI